MKDKTYIVQLNGVLARVRAPRKPSAETMEALEAVARIVSGAAFKISSLKTTIPMSTLTVQTTMSKEVLYDLIGKYNVNIVELENNIPQLQEMADQPGPYQAEVRQSLHETRQSLGILKDKVISCRRTLVARLEMDIEAIDKEIRIAPLLDHTTLHDQRDLLAKELATLHKILADAGFGAIQKPVE